MKAKILRLTMVLLMALAMVVVAVPVASAQPCVDGNIQYWPCSFSFTATQDCAGLSANLEIWGVTSALDWRVETSTSWLSLGPPTSGSWYAGELPDVVPVTVSNTSMSPGTYYGTITIYDWPILSPVPINSVDVPVTLTIPTPTNICYFPSSISWNVLEGDQPADHTLEIWTDGPAPVLNWWVSTDVGWLDLSPGQGTWNTGDPPGKVTVHVNTLMSAGVYTGTITIHGGIPPCSSNSESVAVTLTVRELEPTPTPTPTPSNGEDEGCFIATAAYGSYLDSHVEVLRDFRDQYLLTNPVGSGLVSAYYRLSPPVARFIDDHPALKPVVRAGLLPAVAMSTVAVSTTSTQKTAIVGSLLLVSALAVVWLRRHRRVSL